MTAPAGAGAARVLRAAGVALPGGLGVVAALGAIALLLRPEAWTITAVPVGLAMAWLAWVRPVAAVALLLAVAPICGHRPTTGPFLAFVTLTACAVPGWLARLATRDRTIALDLLATPVGLALTAYAGASLLSLGSLPIYAPGDIVGVASSGVGAAAIAGTLRALPGALAAADVVALAYPVLTVVLTLHAAVAALTVAVASRRDAEPAATGGSAPDAAALVIGGILAGLAATVAAGVLDRLGFVDLRVLRATDPFTNASGADRLQSTFGHAGWFAQYLCFATPAILVLWLGRRRDAMGPGAAAAAIAKRGLRLAAAVTLLVAALAAVVLSYQRGGWITWALIGTGVAAASVRFAAEARGGPDPPPLRRLFAAATAALAIAVVAGLVVVRVAGGPGAMDRFAARARTITQVSDRQVHVTAGLRLGALLPVLGGGSESFAMRYQREYLLAGGAYYDRGRDPLYGMYGSAHNVFAQTFAGKGLVGLTALVLLVIASGAAAVRTLRRPDAPRHARVVAAVALGMVAAFTIYGQVQEVFYVPSLQVTVFAGVGLALALEPPLGSPARSRRRLGVVAALLAAGLAAHLVHGYVVSGRLADEYRDRTISQAGERLSAPVLGEDGEYFQWTGGRAVVTVPRQATELSLELRRAGPTPHDIEVRFDGRPIDRIRLDDDGWRHLVYPLQRVRALPRRLEIVVVSGGDRAAVRRLRWGLP
jgi:O-antigen ligase